MLSVQRNNGYFTYGKSQTPRQDIQEIHPLREA